jgi:hypothetical protein
MVTSFLSWIVTRPKVLCQHMKGNAIPRAPKLSYQCHSARSLLELRPRPDYHCEVGRGSVQRLQGHTKHSTTALIVTAMPLLSQNLHLLLRRSQGHFAPVSSSRRPCLLPVRWPPWHGTPWPLDEKGLGRHPFMFNTIERTSIKTPATRASSRGLHETKCDNAKRIGLLLRKSPECE